MKFYYVLASLLNYYPFLNYVATLSRVVGTITYTI